MNESIAHGYLKDADPIGFENDKNEEFLRTSITKYWERYGGKTYEGLLPKLAIFAANVKEATEEVRPAVKKVLSEDIDIIAPSCGLAPKTPLANVKALVEARNEYFNI